MRGLGIMGLILAVAATATAGPPAVGSKAPNATVRTLAGQTVALHELAKQGPVVVIVLRGYPGYQCPACNQQVGSFLGKAGEFKAAKANVVLIYPGAATGLTGQAEEFLTGKTLPAHFHFATDPDYKFTHAFSLRWDAPNETAYPATFVIDPSGTVRYAKVSTSHGGRSNAAEVLAAVKAAQSSGTR